MGDMCVNGPNNEQICFRTGEAKILSEKEEIQIFGKLPKAESKAKPQSSGELSLGNDLSDAISGKAKAKPKKTPAPPPSHNGTELNGDPMQEFRLE